MHCVMAALAVDDLDRALACGLLSCNSCIGCADACNVLLAGARGERLRALAARERYRARQVRLARRALEHGRPRGLRELPARTPDPDGLPPAAAAALARAKAKAASKR